MPAFHTFSARSITGDPVQFSRYSGQVALVVNVASECGFTPQYEGLEALYETFKDDGFVVLGFPCDQFGHQEPGDSAEIQAFCTGTYGVSFPLFEKIDVNGDLAHPLFKWLKDQKPGFAGTRRIKWNFTKFLIGRDGRVLERWGSATKPEELRSAIEHALQT